MLLEGNSATQGVDPEPPYWEEAQLSAETQDEMPGGENGQGARRCQTCV